MCYRERLCHLVTRPNVEVTEGFIDTGHETLELLDIHIKGCDWVIHLWATGRGRCS